MIEFSFFLFYLTPCIPLSFKGEGEVIFKRGFTPLILSISSSGFYRI